MAAISSLGNLAARTRIVPPVSVRKNPVMGQGMGDNLQKQVLKDNLKQNQAKRKMGKKSGYGNAFPQQRQKDFWSNGIDHNDRTLLRKGEKLGDENRLRNGKRKLVQQESGKVVYKQDPYKDMPSQIERTATDRQESALKNFKREDIAPIKAKREERKINAAKREDDILSDAFSNKTSDNMFRSASATFGTLQRSARKNLAEEGNLKRAGIGVLQSGAVSAGAHGGLAAIQGEDPWEAAKTGFVRGAGVGVGYQGLKAATHTNGSSIMGNIKSMSKTTKQTYGAHTTKGNAALRATKSKDVSPQLLQVLAQGKRSDTVDGIFGFGGR